MPYCCNFSFRWVRLFKNFTLNNTQWLGSTFGFCIYPTLIQANLLQKKKRKLGQNRSNNKINIKISEN